MDRTQALAQALERVTQAKAELSAALQAVRDLWPEAEAELGLSGYGAAPASHQTRTSTRGKQSSGTDFDRVIDALREIGSGRAADIRRRLDAGGQHIPAASIRSYVGRALRSGTVERVDDKPGLYRVPKSPGARGGARSEAHARPGTLSEGAAMSTRAALLDVLKASGRAARIEDLIEPVEKLRGVPFTHKRRTAPLWACVSQRKEFESRSGYVGLAQWPDDKWPEPANEG